MKSSFKILGFWLITLLLSLNSDQVLAQKKDYPEPKIVNPGQNGTPPSDAIILFDHGTLDNFEGLNGSGPAEWKVEGDFFTVSPGTKNIQSKQAFGNCQLHIEWKTPVEEGKQGQGSGNSGVYLMSRYEVQVLNSYQNKTYPDGQAGAIYGNYPPLVNASLPSDQWQTYDIIFTAPVFQNGTQKTPAYITVFHNGVLIQYHRPVEKPTAAFNKNVKEDASKLPFMLQNHGNAVSYRNIWIREL